MFTTLPLEAFVCREVAETYFWPDDLVFNKRRHVLITTALVLSALVGASASLARARTAADASRRSFAHHLRPGFHPRTRRRLLRDGSRLSIPYVPLHPSLSRKLAKSSPLVYCSGSLFPSPVGLRAPARPPASRSLGVCGVRRARHGALDLPQHTKGDQGRVAQAVLKCDRLSLSLSLPRVHWRGVRLSRSVEIERDLDVHERANPASLIPLAARASHVVEFGRCEQVAKQQFYVMRGHLPPRPPPQVDHARPSPTTAGHTPRNPRPRQAGSRTCSEGKPLLLLPLHLRPRRPPRRVLRPNRTSTCRAACRCRAGCRSRRGFASAVAVGPRRRSRRGRCAAEGQELRDSHERQKGGRAKESATHPALGRRP